LTVRRFSDNHDRKTKRSTMKTLRNYKRVRYAIIVFAVIQIILIYDTIRNNSNNKTKSHVRKDFSSIFEINGDVISTTVRADDDDYTLMLNHDDDDGVRTSSHDSKDGQGKRTVYWLNHEQFNYEKKDFDSGSSLMPIKYFLSLNVRGIRSMEDVSHQLYSNLESELRMSVDWMDFAFEDTREWYDPLDLLNDNHNDVAINTITGNLLNYVTSTPWKTRALLSESEPDLHPTLAIIPSAYILKDDSVVSMGRSANLTMTTLAATITSLMRAGVGRILCTCIDETDEIMARETFMWLGELYSGLEGDWIARTEFDYVRMDEELYMTDSEEVSRTRGSIYGMQKALQREFNTSYSRKWFGLDAGYWKHVILTEPGFVYQTRAASLPGIRLALERGRALIPHRFVPVRHETDLTKDKISYDGNSDFLPKNFSDILDLDGDYDMCCDGGSDRPSWNTEDDPSHAACHSWWWNCGYTKELQPQETSEEVKRKRILDFAPLIRMKQGIDIVSIPGTKYRRKCHPRKRQKPNEICERPSPSGRSFATFEKKKW